MLVFDGGFIVFGGLRCLLLVIVFTGVVWCFELNLVLRLCLLVVLGLFVLVFDCWF